jgi:hypothetical protein
VLVNRPPALRRGTAALQQADAESFDSQVRPRFRLCRDIVSATPRHPRRTSRASASPRSATTITKDTKSERPRRRRPLGVDRKRDTDEHDVGALEREPGGGRRRHGGAPPPATALPIAGIARPRPGPYAEDLPGTTRTGRQRYAFSAGRAWSIGNAAPDHARIDVQSCGGAAQNSSDAGRPSGSSTAAQR